MIYIYTYIYKICALSDMWAASIVSYCALFTFHFLKSVFEEQVIILVEYNLPVFPGIGYVFML
jgi:hypothetical protein